MRTFSTEFLGCKVNQYEVEALREGLESLGLVEARRPKAADLFLLNTCSVTAHAGATSRNRIRRAHRANPAAHVLVTGCYATSDRELVEKLPGVVRVFANDEKDRILEFVARELLGREAVPLGPLRVTRMGGHTRAFVKIEDGCDDHCSFCIIPRLRGPATSRDPAEIVAEVEALVDSGHREIVLTGVHLGYFGKGKGLARGAALLSLLDRLARVRGLARLKLSSIEVQEITQPLLELLSSSPVFAPHFHVPLQSGADQTLRRMRRKYNAALYRARIEALRAAFFRPAVSTDVIVGFPGEADEDFAETLAICRQLAFMKIHVFPYSVREGTEAASMPDQVPPQVLERRKLALLDLDRELGGAWRRSFLGARAAVLVEGRRDPMTGKLSGLTDRYVRVLFDGPDRLEGELVDVELVESGPLGYVLGELLQEGVCK